MLDCYSTTRRRLLGVVVFQFRLLLHFFQKLVVQHFVQVVLDGIQTVVSFAVFFDGFQLEDFDDKIVLVLIGCLQVNVVFAFVFHRGYEAASNVVTVFVLQHDYIVFATAIAVVIVFATAIAVVIVFATAVAVTVVFVNVLFFRHVCYLRNYLLLSK